MNALKFLVDPYTCTYNPIISNHNVKLYWDFCSNVSIKPIFNESVTCFFFSVVDPVVQTSCSPGPMLWLE